MALKRRAGAAAPETKTARSSPKNNSDFADIEARIKPVQAMALVIAALFYGRAGTGKTTLAATFPKPLLHLDIREKGTDSISDLADVDSLPVEEWDQFEQAYWYLKANPNKYKTVVIDAVSQLQDYAVEKALDESGKKHEAPSKREWGAASGKLKTWIINYRDLVDLGINVVFLAHDRARDEAEGDEGELMPSIGPRVMPSVASILTASVKLIGNTFIKESTRKLEGGRMERSIAFCLRIGPHAYYDTKVRQPKGSYTPDIMVDPDYNSLVSLMKGEIAPPAATPAPAVSAKKVLRRKS